MIRMRRAANRARHDRWFMGVCSGLAHTYGWRPNTVRLLTAILAIAIPGPSLVLRTGIRGNTYAHGWDRAYHQC
jgi:phage shock protein PspC (stress-responsive transcriptional regulator)